MSLINDALRRASQNDKNRPNRPPTPIGMEPAASDGGSKLTMILGVVVVIALLLAGLLFWQLWKTRHNGNNVAREPNLFPAVTLQVNPQPAVTAKPAPAPVVPGAPVAVPKPAPAPAVAVAPPPVAPPVAPQAAPLVAAPVVVPTLTPVAPDAPVVWPADLKLSAIFFSRTNPRVLINGNIYGVGDQVQGITLKRIGKEKVTLEWNGHTKDLMLEGQ